MLERILPPQTSLSFSVTRIPDAECVRGLRYQFVATVVWPDGTQHVLKPIKTRRYYVTSHVERCVRSQAVALRMARIDAGLRNA